MAKRNAAISRALKGGFKSGGTIGNISGGITANVSVKSSGGGSATQTYSGIGTSSTGEANRTIEDIQKAGAIGEKPTAQTRADVFSTAAKEKFNIQQSGGVFSTTIAGIKTSVKGNLPVTRYTNYPSGRRYEYVGSEVSGPASDSLTLRPEFASGERYTPGRREAKDAKANANALYKANQALRGYDLRPQEKYGGLLVAASGRGDTLFGQRLLATYQKEAYRPSQPETFMSHYYPYGSAKTEGMGFTSDISRPNKEELGIKASVIAKLKKIEGITNFYDTTTTALKTYPLTSELFLKEGEVPLPVPKVTAGYSFAPAVRAWNTRAESMPDLGFKDLIISKEYKFNRFKSIKISMINPFAVQYEARKTYARVASKQASDFAESPVKYAASNIFMFKGFQLATPFLSTALTKATVFGSIGKITLSEKLSSTLVGSGLLGSWAFGKVMERPDRFTKPAGYLEFGAEVGYYSALFKGIGKFDKGTAITRAFELKSKPFSVTTSPLSRADVTATLGENERIGYLRTKVLGITARKTPLTVTDTMESLNQLVKYNKVSEKGYFKTTLTEGLPWQKVVGQKFEGSITNRFNLESTLSYYGKIRTTGAIKTTYDFPGYQKQLYLSSRRSSNYLNPSKGRQSPFLSGMLTQPTRSMVDAQAIGTTDIYRRNIFNMFTGLGEGKDLNEYSEAIDINYLPDSTIKYKWSLGKAAGTYDPILDKITYSLKYMIFKPKEFANTKWHERQHAKDSFYELHFGKLNIAKAAFTSPAEGGRLMSKTEILKSNTSPARLNYLWRLNAEYRRAIFDVYRLPNREYEVYKYYGEIPAFIAGDYFSLGKSSVSKKFPLLTKYFEATANLKPYRLKPSSISTDFTMTNIISKSGEGKPVDYWGNAGDFVISERANYNIRYGPYSIKLSGLASGRAIAMPESYPPRLNVRGKTIKYEGKVRGTRFNFYQETLGDIYQMDGYQKGFTQTSSTLQMGRLSDKSTIDYVYTSKSIAPDVTKTLASGREVRGINIKPAFSGYDYQFKLATVSDNDYTQTFYLTRGMKGTGANVISALKQGNIVYPNMPQSRISEYLGRFDKPLSSTNAIKSPAGKSLTFKFGSITPGITPGATAQKLSPVVKQQSFIPELISRQGLLSTGRKIATSQYLKKGFAPAFATNLMKQNKQVGTLKNIAVGELLTQTKQTSTLNQINQLDLFSVGRLNSIALTKNIQISQAIGKTITMTRLNAITRGIGVQKQIQVAKQTQLQTAINVSVGASKTQKIPVFTMIPIVTVPPPPIIQFKLLPSRSDFGFKKRKSSNVIFHPKYFSSIEANIFNIRGKRPSWQNIATGLNIRPMVRI